jgi:hypothetical protein
MYPHILETGTRPNALPEGLEVREPTAFYSAR